MGCVKIRSPGWGPSDLDDQELSISPSTQETKFLTPLRPDDVFLIASKTLSVEVRHPGHLAKYAEVQVTSSTASGHDIDMAQNIVDLEDRPINGSLDRDLYQANLPSTTIISDHRPSTPPKPYHRPLAVLETPTADRTRQVMTDPVAIMSSIDGSGTKNLPGVDAETAERRTVEPATIIKHNEDHVGQVTINTPHAIDCQSASTTEEDSDDSAPIPQPETSVRNMDPNQDSMRSTVQVEIPITKKPPSEKAQLSRKRKAKSSRNSAEPTSSSRSTRSNPREGSTSSTFPHSDIKILFASSTSSDNSPQFAKFLKKQGVKTVKSVTECTVLCVGKGVELKKTSNLILAVASGRDIITDDWITQSATKGEILDFQDFLAKDPKREVEWGTTLSEAIKRGRQGTKPLLGYTIHFTLTAKHELGKGFTDLKEIAVFSGAECIKTAVPRKSPDESPMTMVIAANDDKDFPTLEEKSWKAFSKEIITLSVLRGCLDLDSDEFRLNGPVHKQSGVGKKRKR